MSFREKLSSFWNNVQFKLFPDLENRVGGELSDEYKRLVAILELIRIEEFLPCTKFNFGRPLKDRTQISRAFVAKIVLKITYNKKLVSLLKGDVKLRTICGWNSSQIPSEAKFSRAFKEFAISNLPERVHQALLTEVYKDTIIGHVVKDSTPIQARELPLKKEGSTIDRRKLLNKLQAQEKKRGESRKQKQLIQDLNITLEALPSRCDVGSKKMSNGLFTTWKGYKLHVAIDDSCIPLATILTSASLNDSEVAIPLAIKSDKVAKNFYDLMDSAYNSPEIKLHSLSLGHVPIIDQRPRNSDQKEQKRAESKRKRILNIYTAEDIRYRQRAPKERFNAIFKDYYGGKNIWYRGHTKVYCHLMFGVLALTATMLLDFT